MKTTKLTLTALFVITAVFFLGIITASCENPLALGEKLDLEGPVVTITKPAETGAVINAEYGLDLEGTVLDRNIVERLSVSVERNGVKYPKQWRYTRSDGWQVSQNNGASWSALPSSSPASWNGDTDVTWKVHIDLDLEVGGVVTDAEDGEYMFLVQAWDTGEMSDDRSFRTITIIYDTDFPVVEVFNPFLYTRHAKFQSGTFIVPSPINPSNVVELNQLHALSDDDWRQPKYLGKFLTQDFRLNWQIDDKYALQSIELHFYDAATVTIDEDPTTSLPSDDALFIYKPSGMIKPNDYYDVPDLFLAGKITTKTTIQVVAHCEDKAGHVNQERTLGYFIYWPQARYPWIEYPNGMNTALSVYNGMTKAQFERPVNIQTPANGGAYMIYPGRTIKANAYQAQGVKEVRYTLHPWEIAVGDTTLQTSKIGAAIATKTLSNDQRSNGGYSTTFNWGLDELEAKSAYYVIRATPYDYKGNPATPPEQVVFEAAFRVQDLSYPSFPTDPYPPANEPLFKYIGRHNGDPVDSAAAPADSIRISGVVTDATKVDSLYLVWINPASKSYNAMSQLSYFRDANYVGWDNAIKHTGDDWPINEGVYDSANPNKVWRIRTLTQITDDPVTHRKQFRYNLNIPLSTLNISPAEAAQKLKSQVFLLRAANPDNKTDIITYAPQGDTVVPTIEIVDVRISGDTTVYEPGDGKNIPQLTSQTVTVNGKWTEDSTEFLNSQTYFYNNMKFSISGVNLATGTGGVNITYSPNAATAAKEGTFVITAVVGASNTLKPANLRDTLVVNASVTDIGGNTAEDSASWLVQPDEVRFLRISSTNEDQAYKAGDVIRIFIEFNKAVVLKPGRTPTNLALLVNAGGGTTTTGRAVYDTSNTESTRVFFNYTVAAGHNTGTAAPARLNVTGISIDGGTTALGTTSTAWQNADYPFTFVHTANDGKVEEIRLTRNSAHVSGTNRIGTWIASGAHWARLVPVSNSTTDADYLYTLAGGKEITVDTTAPNATAVAATPTGWHKAGVDIYITATFNEQVRIDPDDIPYLILGTGGTSPNNRTSTAAADIRENGNQIIFKYTVKANDTATANDLQVTGIGGKILDIPGNEMSTTSNWFTATPAKRLTGVRLDTEKPARPPTVQVFQGTTASPGAEITPIPGNLYYDNVFVRITGVGTTGDNTNLGRVEYSLNDTTAGGNNPTWTSSAAAVTNYQLSNNGTFNISAKQTDQAGNESDLSTKITFNLDKGALVSNINSFTSNGTYTNNTARPNDSINITVNFRKALSFTGTQTITLNAVNSSGGSTRVTVDAPAPATATNQLTFTYTVGAGHNTGNPTPALLDVTGLSLTANDGGVPVPSAFLNALPTATADLLRGRKEIYIATGGLTITTQPAFANGALADDGSYTATLRVVFARAIFKSAGTIEIIQSAANYRIPAVLTEAQSGKFISGIANFGTYYSRGTNGYISGTGPDTSTKYVLAYTFDPTSPTTGAQTTFTEAFRQAEKVTIPVTSSAVTITNSTGGATGTLNTLSIALTGSNALQVPGATYSITIPAGLVQDSLSNPSPAPTTTSLTASGFVAKPFVRVQKVQDTVAIRTGGATTSAIHATQPLTTNARLDCRTPETTIRYITADATTTAPGTNNWNSTVDPPADTTTPATPTRPNAPTTTTGTAYNNQITIGTVAGATYAERLTAVQGYQWHIRARAFSGNTASADSDEMAYRSVLTYQIRDMAVNTGEAGQNIASGNHVWIRGGDAISSSNIPGFPLTWEDDWQTLKDEKRRAGIRVMDLVTATTQLYTASTWRWVTWEINVPAYFDFILSNDAPTNDAANTARVTQYGPQSFAYQRAGWTSFKVNYRLNPGKHRWMYVDGDSGTGPGFNTSKGRVNFARPFMARPAMNGTGDVTYP